MLEINDFLTKEENLLRLNLHQYYLIDKASKKNWLTQIQNTYDKIGKDKIFSVRSKNGETAVIRTR